MEVFGNLDDGFADGFGRRRRFGVDIFIGLRREVAFRKGSDASHSFYGFYRIEATSRFAAEHDGVCAIEDGVGDVARFSPCRTRVVAHGFQHLRRRNDRFARSLAFMDKDFLEHRYFFRRDFDAEVTTGDHDAVAHLNDIVDVVDCSLTFDFGDNLHVAVVFFQNLADRQDIFAALDERSGNPVHIHAAAKFDVGGIGFRNGRQVDGDARYGNALAVAHLAAVEDLRMDIFAFDADNFQVDQAVRQEDVVAGFDVLRQFFIVHGGNRFVAFDVTGRQGKVLAGFHHDRAILKFAQTDFRAFRVQEQCHRDTQFLGGSADHVDALFMFFMRTMGEIKAGNVHAGFNHLFDNFRGIGTGA